MQELKQASKRPLVFYYVVAMLILMVLNMTFFPSVLGRQVQEVSYTDFMAMTYDDDIGLVEIEGEVPMSEMGDFSTMLRSTTQGRGNFTFQFARYELLPQQLEAGVIEEAKKFMEQE